MLYNQNILLLEFINIIYFNIVFLLKINYIWLYIWSYNLIKLNFFIYTPGIEHLFLIYIGWLINTYYTNYNNFFLSLLFGGYWAIYSLIWGFWWVNDNIEILLFLNILIILIYKHKYIYINNIYIYIYILYIYYIFNRFGLLNGNNNHYFINIFSYVNKIMFIYFYINIKYLFYNFYINIFKINNFYINLLYIYIKIKFIYIYYYYKYYVLIYHNLIFLIFLIGNIKLYNIILYPYFIILIIIIS